MIVGVIIQICIIVSSLWGIEFSSEESDFLSRDCTERLRWLACWIVVLAHIQIPEKYHLMGCLHFVFVSLFYFLSGYGLTCSLLKQNYQCDSEGNAFAKKTPKRIMKLLIPFGIIIGVKYFLGIGKSIVDWGIQFLPQIALFYFIYTIFTYIIKDIRKFSWIVSLFFSFGIPFLMYYVLDYYDGNSEIVGYGLGIVVAIYYKKIGAWLRKKSVAIIILSLLSLLFFGVVYLKIRTADHISDIEFYIRYPINSIFILCVLVVSTFFRFKNSFLMKGCSLLVFVIHGLIIDCLNLYIDKEGNPILYMLCVVVGVTMFVVMGMYLNSLYKRIKRREKV